MLPRTLLSHHCALQVTTWHTKWPFCIVLSELHSNIITSGTILLLYKLCNFLMKLTLCWMLQWWNWPHRDLHPDWHGAEPHGQRWSVYFLVCICVCTEVFKQFTVFCLSWTGCIVPTGVKEIDIAATLEHVRDQRPGMVRTKVIEATSPLFVRLLTECWQSCQFGFCNLCLLSIFIPDFNPPKTSLRVWLFAVSDWPCVLLLSPGPVWVCLDGRCWGGQRHPQSSAPVKPGSTRTGPDNHQALQLWLLHLLSYLSFSLTTMMMIDILQNGPRTFSLPLT